MKRKQLQRYEPPTTTLHPIVAEGPILAGSPDVVKMSNPDSSVKVSDYEQDTGFGTSGTFSAEF